MASVPRVWEECGGGVGPVAPFHTTDHFLAALLGAPSGSERLIKVFSVLPAKTPVIVMYPDGDWGNTFTAYILSYFGWPKEVRLLAVNRENAPASFEAIDQASVSAIFLCGIDPPASMQPGIRLGTQLVVVPTPGRK